MYSAVLTINGRAINFDSATVNGCYIRTITGLTGVTSKLQTAQHSSGYGEAYTGAQVAGQPIRIEGYILGDSSGAMTIRKAMIDNIVPKGEGTLKVGHVINSDQQTELTCDVVVQTTPQITQECNAKFSIALYAPRAVWYASSYSTTSVEQGTTATIRVDGQIDAEYDVSILCAAAALTSVTLTLDGGTRDAKVLTLDLTRYTGGSVAANKTIYIRRTNGQLGIYVQGTGTTLVSAMQCLNVDSTFWYLPVGTHTLALSTNTTAAVSATVKYKPLYAGVIVSGV